MIAPLSKSTSFVHATGCLPKKQVFWRASRAPGGLTGSPATVWPGARSLPIWPATGRLAWAPVPPFHSTDASSLVLDLSCSPKFDLHSSCWPKLETYSNNFLTSPMNRTHQCFSMEVTDNIFVAKGRWFALIRKYE